MVFQVKVGWSSMQKTWVGAKLKENTGRYERVIETLTNYEFQAPNMKLRSVFFLLGILKP